MQIDKLSGRLVDTKYSHSPNFDERPAGCAIDLLVIHGISLPPGEFGSNDVEALFTNQLDANKHPYFQAIADAKVSSHLFIRRDGEIIQFVPFSKRAWHAGRSVFQDRENCNDFSIGIELEGTDTMAYSDPQYQQLARVTRAIMRVYTAITPDRIVGHSDIAPHRKTDPGPSFDWVAYRQLITSFSADQQNDSRAPIAT
ncbi:MAG: 1,6-anhydro-N-acetylmuramyl-L-alanine amidase AmpD [Candidatus Berkiella sp.]